MKVTSLQTVKNQWDQKCTATIWHFESLWSRASEGLEFTLESREFRCFEAKIEESEKAGSHWELNPGHQARAASTLPLSYDNWTALNHNPLYVLPEMLQSQTWQQLSMWFSKSCCVSQHCAFPHTMFLSKQTHVGRATSWPNPESSLHHPWVEPPADPTLKVPYIIPE